MISVRDIDEYISDCERDAKDEAEKIAFNELLRERMRPNLSRNDNIEVDSINLELRELRRERMRPFLGMR